MLTLVAVNSKYVHMNLAVRKIRAYLQSQGLDARIKEFSGGEELPRMAAEILDGQPDDIAFSCYIWNIGTVLRLAELIRKSGSPARLILGGPEAAYRAQELLDRYPFVDMVAQGEGEELYARLLQGAPRSKIMFGQPLEMEQHPFPYTQEDLSQPCRIFYYESSRGCPHGCSYCLSSAQRGVRFKPLAQVFSDLQKFSDAGVRLVKFVDRTFNANLKRSKELLRYLSTLSPQFHIEVAADTLDQEFLELLAAFAPGQLRIEAGLQSANPQTLEAIGRRCDLTRLAENLRYILQNTGCILHLDLIAGLPYESLESFAESFRFAFLLHPHELQLGFLKVLPGTRIASQTRAFGIEAASYTPYEIIRSRYLSFAELSLLKDVEAALEFYHNSGILFFTEPLLLERQPHPFLLYRSIAEFLRKNGLLSTPHHRTGLFDFIYRYLEENGLCSQSLRLALAKDFLLSCKGAPLPGWLGPADKRPKKERLNQILTNDRLLAGLPRLCGVEKAARHKYVRVESIFGRVWFLSNIDKKLMDFTPYF